MLTELLGDLDYQYITECQKRLIELENDCAVSVPSAVQCECNLKINAVLAAVRVEFRPILGMVSETIHLAICFDRDRYFLRKNNFEHYRALKKRRG